MTKKKSEKEIRKDIGHKQFSIMLGRFSSWQMMGNWMYHSAIILMEQVWKARLEFDKISERIKEFNPGDQY
jgi:hypothetical protein